MKVVISKIDNSENRTVHFCDFVRMDILSGILHIGSVSDFVADKKKGTHVKTMYVMLKADEIYTITQN